MNLDRAPSRSPTLVLETRTHRPAFVLAPPQQNYAIVPAGEGVPQLERALRAIESDVDRITAPLVISVKKADRLTRAMSGYILGGASLLIGLSVTAMSLVDGGLAAGIPTGASGMLGLGALATGAAAAVSKFGDTWAAGRRNSKLQKVAIAHEAESALIPSAFAQTRGLERIFFALRAKEMLERAHDANIADTSLGVRLGKIATVYDHASDTEKKVTKAVLDLWRVALDPDQVEWVTYRAAQLEPAERDLFARVIAGTLAERLENDPGDRYRIQRLQSTLVGEPVPYKTAVPVETQVSIDAVRDSSQSLVTYATYQLGNQLGAPRPEKERVYARTSLDDTKTAEAESVAAYFEKLGYAASLYVGSNKVFITVYNPASPPPGWYCRGIGQVG